MFNRGAALLSAGIPADVGGDVHAELGGCCSAQTTVTTNSARQDKDNDMSTTTATTFAVTGMTCSHCVTAVTEELSALPGVTEVSVDLVAGGTSTVTVTSDSPRRVATG
jgi:copper chaperone CopZ